MKNGISTLGSESDSWWAGVIHTQAYVSFLFVNRGHNLIHATKILYNKWGLSMVLNS